MEYSEIDKKFIHDVDDGERERDAKIAVKTMRATYMHICIYLYSFWLSSLHESQGVCGINDTVLYDPTMHNDF